VFTTGDLDDMIRAITGASLIVFAACAAFGQTAAAPLQFEVASIKPSPPISGGMIRIGMTGGPGSPSPETINCFNYSLKQLVIAAYGVKDYQVTGPDWIASERFDITAKVPAKATRADVQVMWQALLADRFKMTIHHDKKDVPMYALVVAKNGPRLPPAKEDDPAAPGTTPGTTPGTNPGAAPMPERAIVVGGVPAAQSGQMSFSMGKSPAGGRGSGLQMRPGHIYAKKTNMLAFTTVLGSMGGVDRPIVDMTGLTGNYEVTLDWTPDPNGRSMLAGLGISLPASTPRVDSGADGAAADSPNATIFTALQEMLGLKLEPRKSAVDVIAIDHVEKVATEN
jgi:uncharacterized protein (TIGR03435 family)